MKYRIIIVEDEVLIAEDLRDVIESLGYEVADVCHNSERALAQIHTLRPDMVILDISIRGTKLAKPDSGGVVVAASCATALEINISDRDIFIKN